MSDWQAWMRRAIELALAPDVPRSANPRVGCVIVDASGQLVGEGFHRGAGSEHAEVVALRAAGERARGGAAIVTLEPCRHTGRTGPCTAALIEAGIATVVFAQHDPSRQAGGGREVLRSAGIEVIGGVLLAEAEQVTLGWTHLARTGRPLVTAKCAMSLDGRVSGPSGEPIAITGEGANAWSHRFRGHVDAICVGTGTVIADDPRITARDASGDLLPRQPLRVVVGKRDLPAGLRVFDGAAPTLVVPSHEPQEVLAALMERHVHHALIEGGPTLCGAFLDAGLVDEVLWWIAPRLLGSGLPALARLGRPVPVDVVAVEQIGEDVLVRGRIGKATEATGSGCSLE
ncbi:MAG: bifunctional diaminohydroxyphosphoribosylaminopyrimidine deaminase/5-amino-6-(5-phosphoribosylamino)uracil reductase RibD [Actinomycetales bacterium]|nr:bifunctional diaminohydroxyphosphoribosylaminopyrimidine deaminase/5-amino-6-(5-phosphoribosylamino)uracil reductase RibD [Actinomycetales bacterium]